MDTAKDLECKNLKPLYPAVTDDDIIGKLPQLKDNGFVVHGTAESGTISTIESKELERYPVDYFKGGLAYSMDKDETREVVSSAGDTVATEPFSGAILKDRYILTRSFTREIKKAGELIGEFCLKQDGCIMPLGTNLKNPELLREIHILKAVALVCFGMREETGALDTEGFWWTLGKEYKNRAGRLFKDLEYEEEHEHVKEPVVTEVTVPLTIANLQEAVHALAKEKGWWPGLLDSARPFIVDIPEKLCLIHSEVSEALECYREGDRGEGGNYIDPATGKPEGLASELADVVIRTLDLAEALGIDLQGAIQLKHEYNKSRQTGWARLKAHYAVEHPKELEAIGEYTGRVEEENG